MITAVVHGDSGGGASSGLVWLILIGLIVLVIAFFGTFVRGIGERLPAFLTSMPGASSDNSLSFGTIILGSLVVAILVVLAVRN